MHVFNSLFIPRVPICSLYAFYLKRTIEIVSSAIQLLGGDAGDLVISGINCQVSINLMADHYSRYVFVVWEFSFSCAISFVC